MVCLHLINYLLISLDGPEAPQAMEDGMELEEPPKDATELSAIPIEPEMPSEFEKLYRGCEENPEDFNAWVYLLQYVEQEVINVWIFILCAVKN